MPSLLKGKAALITAASSERGAAIAAALSGEGCAVALHYYKNKAAAENTQEKINEKGGRAEIFQADLSSDKEVETLFVNISGCMGRLQILVNNAHAEIIRKPFLESSWPEYQRQLEVALKGSWLTCRHFTKQMGDGREGSIVQILNAQLNQPVPGYGAFVSALSALDGFSKNLALEAAPLGIRVNAVAPGFTKTEKTPHAPPRAQEKIIRETPLGRLATPEDIGNAVVFFASGLSGFVTGTCLTVDGGRALF